MASGSMALGTTRLCSGGGSPPSPRMGARAVDLHGARGEAAAEREAASGEGGGERPGVSEGAGGGEGGGRRRGWMRRARGVRVRGNGDGAARRNAIPTPTKTELLPKVYCDQSILRCTVPTPGTASTGVYLFW